MQKILRMTCMMACFGICIPAFVCAETVVLRNGERIEGEITKDTAKYIKVKTAVGETIYFKSAIKSIDQKDVVLGVPAGDDQPVAIPPGSEATEVILPGEPVEPLDVPQPQQSVQDDAQLTSVPEPLVSQPSLAQEPFVTLKILYEITEKDPQTERSFSSVVYIDRNANKRRSDLTEIFQPGQMHAKRDEITIVDAAQRYFFDMAKGVASVNDNSDTLSVWVDSGNETLKEEDAIAKQIVAGKKCLVYKIGDVQIWVWQGITLKRIEKNERVYKRFEAMSVEENIPLSADIFTIPESIKVNISRKVTDLVEPQVTLPEVIPESVEPAVPQKKPAAREQKQDDITPRLTEAKRVKPMKAPLQKPVLPVEQFSESTVTISPEDFRALKQGGTGALEALAKIDLSNIETGLELYRVDTGKYPSTAQGLRVLIAPPSQKENWQGPYLTKEPRDPWGNSYVYTVSAKNGFGLYSKGPDGKAHTEDDITK